MALSYIWAAFFLVGFAAALAQWIILGDPSVFKKVVDGTFDSARVASAVGQAMPDVQERWRSTTTSSGTA